MSDGHSNINPGEDDSPTVNPGRRKVFVYTGNQAPFQVTIANLDPTNEAQVMMQGLEETDRPGWGWYDTLLPGSTISVWVNWPTQALITNRGSLAPIEVSGDGIFTLQGMKGGGS